METKIIEREYRMLVNEREKLGRAIRLLMSRKRNSFYGGNDLLELASLKIRGGPKNLAARLDFYLYGA